MASNAASSRVIRAGELARRHRLTPSAVSHHLSALHRAGFVLKSREQHRVSYQLSERGHALAALYD
ncbi:hypothetical protein VM98_21690 [Streptomyces rubellomurinus subsp. indigoferus]|nr:hypothetical protein VM98_21690 [Streptomyces rubellomurinus subsp. indigoferus]